MNYRKPLYLLSIILAVFIVFSPLKAFADDIMEFEGVSFLAWTDSLAVEQNGSGSSASNCLPSVPGNYYLLSDVSISNTWNSPAGTIRICLNGKAINANASGNIENRMVITIPVNSELHIFDNEGSGIITSGYMSNGDGAGVRIEGGTFYLHSGSITGNTGGKGSGVYVGEGGTFYMMGGSVTGNPCTYQMDSSGVYVASGGIISISGKINIAGNTKQDEFYNTYDCNVLLETGAVINVIGPLEARTKIGVDTITIPTNGSPVKVATGLSSSRDVRYLFADKSNSLHVEVDALGDAYLVSGRAPSVDLFIDGEPVIEVLADDFYGDGTVKYNPVSNKLTLKNANIVYEDYAQYINGSGDVCRIYSGIYYNGDLPLIIELIGTNSITSATNIFSLRLDDANCGICCSNEIVFEGNGKLVTASGEMSYEGPCCGIRATIITVNGQIIEAYGGKAAERYSAGIDGVLHLKYGDVKTKGGDSTNGESFGCRSIVVDDGNLVVESGTAYGSSIAIEGSLEVNNGTVDIKSGSNINDGSNFEYQSTGVYGVVLVKGGFVNILAGDSTVNSYGIHNLNVGSGYVSNIKGGVLNVSTSFGKRSSIAIYGSNGYGGLTIDGGDTTITAGKSNRESICVGCTSFQMNAGSVVAVSGEAPDSIPCNAQLSINGGSLELIAAGPGTNVQVCSSQPVIGGHANVQTVSTNSDGSDPVDYVPGNYAQYKYLKSGDIPGWNTTYNVQITPGSGMLPAETYSETVSSSDSMTAQVYTADSGYYFPEGYAVSFNGINVTRNSSTQITVAGIPTTDTAIVLPDATAESIATERFAIEFSQSGIAVDSLSKDESFTLNVLSPGIPLTDFEGGAGFTLSFDPEAIDLVSIDSTDLSGCDLSNDVTDLDTAKSSGIITINSSRVESPLTAGEAVIRSTISPRRSGSATFEFIIDELSTALGEESKVKYTTTINRDVHIHEWSSGEITKKATPYVQGERTAACTLCGEIKTEYFDYDGLLGDINGDGSITNYDATLLRRHLARRLTLTEDQLIPADINGDGNVNNYDATRLRLYIAGRIDSLMNNTSNPSGGSDPSGNGENRLLTGARNTDGVITIGGKSVAASCDTTNVAVYSNGESVGTEAGITVALYDIYEVVTNTVDEVIKVISRQTWAVNGAVQYDPDADTINLANVDGTGVHTLCGFDFPLNDDNTINTGAFILEGVSSLSDISKDNIVYVYAGPVSNSITKITVGTAVAEGKVTKISSNNDTFTIGGNDYKLAICATVDPAYFMAWLNGGNTIKAYLGPDGRIYSAKAVTSTTNTIYGILLKSERKTTGITDNLAKVQIFTQNGETVIYDMVSALDSDGANGISGGTAFASQGDLVEFSINAQGQIKDVIATAALPGSYGSTVIGDHGLVGGAFIDEDTVVFAYTDDGSANSIAKVENYSVITGPMLYGQTLCIGTIAGTSATKLTAVIVDGTGIVNKNAEYVIFTGYDIVQNGDLIHVLGVSSGSAAYIGDNTEFAIPTIYGACAYTLRFNVDGVATVDQTKVSGFNAETVTTLSVDGYQAVINGAAIEVETDITIFRKTGSWSISSGSSGLTNAIGGSLSLINTDTDAAYEIAVIIK